MLHMSVIPVRGKPRQEDLSLEASLGCGVRAYLKKTKHSWALVPLTRL